MGKFDVDSKYIHGMLDPKYFGKCQRYIQSDRQKDAL